MAGFYIPFTTKIKDKRVIVYPCVGLEKVIERSQSKSIENLLKQLYSKNEQLLKNGEYHIIILWDEASDDKSASTTDVMSDVWIFDKLESWGSGPLVDVKIFRNISPETNIGVSAGDGLLMLGREEELRRTSKSLDEYLNSIRAVLPEDIAAKVDFYL